MRKAHKITLVAVLCLVSIICFLCDLSITSAVSQMLVTFFSIIFGFYISSVAILYHSHYLKWMYNNIDNKAGMRGTHKLRLYLISCGQLIILSIVLLITYVVLEPKIQDLEIFYIDISRMASALLFGISGQNIFSMLLLLHTIVNGIIEEGKLQAEQ